MIGLNKAYLIGYVGAAPEARTSATGMKVTTVSLATNTQARDEDGGVGLADWHRVTAYGKVAEHLATVEKGFHLAVECTIRPNTWRTADGKEHPSITLIVERVLWVHAPPPKPI